jgi:hypothetical protein
MYLLIKTRKVLIPHVATVRSCQQTAGMRGPFIYGTAPVLPLPTSPPVPRTCRCLHMRESQNGTSTEGGGGREVEAGDSQRSSRLESKEACSRGRFESRRGFKAGTYIHSSVFFCSSRLRCLLCSLSLPRSSEWGFLHLEHGLAKPRAAVPLTNLAGVVVYACYSPVGVDY